MIWYSNQKSCRLLFFWFAGYINPCVFTESKTCLWKTAKLRKLLCVFKSEEEGTKKYIKKKKKP